MAYVQSETEMRTYPRAVPGQNWCTGSPEARGGGRNTAILSTPCRAASGSLPWLEINGDIKNLCRLENKAMKDHSQI
jgi:hypothetical protein